MLRKWIIVLFANWHYFVNTQDDEEDSDSDDDDLSDADLVETALESYTTPIDNEEDLENAVDEYVSFKEVMSGKYTEKPDGLSCMKNIQIVLLTNSYILTRPSLVCTSH